MKSTTFIISLLCLLITSTIGGAIPGLSNRDDSPLAIDIKACLAQDDCACANRVFKWCTETTPGVHDANNWNPGPNGAHTPDNTLSYNCLCTTYHDEWLTALQTCTTCITSALLAHPIVNFTPAPLNPTGLWNNLNTQIASYCAAADEATSNLHNLIGYGQLQSYNFRSQVLFYNITLITTDAYSQFGGYLLNDPASPLK